MARLTYKIGDKIDKRSPGELFEIAAALDRLSSFMKATAVAKQMRAAGDETRALLSDDAAIQHHDKLPDNWR